MRYLVAAIMLFVLFAVVALAALFSHWVTRQK
jgi:hypothetical protein